MTSVLKDRNKKFSSKRIVSIACVIVAIILAFMNYNFEVVIAFLTSGVGSNALTLKEK